MFWKSGTLLLACGLTVLLTHPAPAAGGPSSADEQTLANARIATDGPSLLDLFRKQTHAGADREKVRTLVRQLGDDSFEAREQASTELAAIGALARPLLEQALRDPDPEVVYRARDCLQRIKGEKGSNAPLLAAAARLLAARRPAGAAEVLLSYFPSADESVAEEIRTTLTALAVRPGDQVNRTVNPNFVPVSQQFGTLTGTALQPAPSFQRTDFWVQGINLGLEFRY